MLARVLLYGCGLLAALFWATRLATGALGGGDVKYSSAIGLFLGLPWCFVSVFLSASAALAFSLRSDIRAHGGAASSQVAAGPDWPARA
jgi:prepilin signal peptidase PulO-like enzyme (type II secretory pathway)